MFLLSRSSDQFLESTKHAVRKRLIRIGRVFVVKYLIEVVDLDFVLVDHSFNPRMVYKMVNICKMF